MKESVVECHAGAYYPERPRSFLWEGERLEVEEIERRWRTPDGLVFRVRASNNHRFKLTYNEASDVWDVRAASR